MDNPETPNLAYALVGLLIIIFVYFLPAVVAKIRKHPATLSIELLNLLLGWTFLFWVIALVWASLPAASTKNKS